LDRSSVIIKVKRIREDRHNKKNLLKTFWVFFFGFGFGFWFCECLACSAAHLKPRHFWKLATKKTPSPVARQETERRGERERKRQHEEKSLGLTDRRTTPSGLLFYLAQQFWVYWVMWKDRTTGKKKNRGGGGVRECERRTSVMWLRISYSRQTGPRGRKEA
jgi:hypothetical protein